MTDKKDDAIVEEAKKRFARGEEADRDFRELYVKDLKFSFGDSDNMYQWSDGEYQTRQRESRPALTVNRVDQHVIKIVNSARVNSPQIKVHPSDGAASSDAADVYDGLLRHIQYESDADKAYDIGLESAVRGGVGYWRVTTDYIGDRSFQQRIKIDQVPNAMSVVMDPDRKISEGEDARWAILYEDMSRERFEADYPKEEVESVDFTGNIDKWMTGKEVRIAEYFRIVEQPMTIYALPDGSVARKSELSPEQIAELESMQARSRVSREAHTEWYLLAGNRILRRREWPGKYIPVICVVGQELNINGKNHRRGLTRTMKDPQRMYDYWTSSAVEHVALQTKVPWVVAAESIEGHEQYWDNANTVNYSHLPYNAFSTDGTTALPKPERPMPPVMPQAYMQGMQVAAEEMKMASGQFEANFGEPSNETSGRAIYARSSQGDQSTFHYIDNQARALRYTGKILIDLVPKVLDVPQVITTVGLDGSRAFAQISPGSGVSYQEGRDQAGEIMKIFDPTVGEYSVVVDVGPSFSTRRAEGFSVMSDLISKAPELMKVAGDLMMKSADFPFAEQIADRLKKTIPAQLLDDKSDPQVDALKQQLQQVGGALQQALQELAANQHKQDWDKAKIEIEAYKAETDRFKVIPPDPQQIAILTAQLLRQALASPLPTGDISAPAIQGNAPVGQPPMSDIGPGASAPNPMPNEPPPGGFSLPGQ